MIKTLPVSVNPAITRQRIKSSRRACAWNKQMMSSAGVDANIVIFTVIVLGVNRPCSGRVIQRILEH